MRATNSRHASLVVLLGLAVLLADSGCDSSCTAECDEQHEDCVDRAPPGASKQDCAAQYEQCLARCDATVAPALDE